MSLDWRQLAACRRSDLEPDTWFPDQGDKAARTAALRICRTCPVIRDCALYALRTQPPFGVWGGMTSRQISALTGVPAAQRTKTVVEVHKRPCGTLSAYKRHLRKGERACESCLQANRRANHDRVSR